jgi:tRNA A-37 threonylcarbamoyl transferase component Bud32
VAAGTWLSRPWVAKAPGLVETQPGLGGGGDIDISPGDRVNEYQIVGRLGEGGMGTVFEGVQPVIGKRVAIKVLRRECAANPELVNRFIQEARAVNQARSPHIVDIFSFGELRDGRHYFVMEYLDGLPLKAYLEKRKVLTFDEAYAILNSVTKGLAAAHDTGIIHRDIKPENIVVLTDSEGGMGAKVLDFGIAKLQGDQADPSFATRTGAAMGTPYYMSPEQCQGVNVDHRTDIYALGIIMFEMFTGQLPFTAGSYIDLVNKHLFASPPEPRSINGDISPQLEAMILRCIAKDPDERPQTMKQFRSELKELLPSLRKTSPSEVKIPAITERAAGKAGEAGQNARPSIRSRAAWLGAGLALVLLALGVGIYLAVQGQPTGETQRAILATAVESRDTQQTDRTEAAAAAPVASAVASALDAAIDGMARPDSKPASTKLMVQTKILNTSYYLDQKLVGKGPRLIKEGIPSGRYVLMVSAPGHHKITRAITLKPEKALSLSFKLRRRTRPATQKEGATSARPEDPDDTLDPFK